MAEHSSEHHIVPLKYYFGVFALLMVLTALTVAVAYFDFGRFNLLVAMTIAVIKATAVILIFMHVRWSSKLTQVVVLSGIFWLIIMLVFTISDYLTRGGWPTNLGQ
jgi:cytochrome c oxidase subunit 4